MYADAFIRHRVVCGAHCRRVFLRPFAIRVAEKSRAGVRARCPPWRVAQQDVRRSRLRRRRYHDVRHRCRHRRRHRHHHQYYCRRRRRHRHRRVLESATRSQFAMIVVAVNVVVPVAVSAMWRVCVGRAIIRYENNNIVITLFNTLYIILYIYIFYTFYTDSERKNKRVGRIFII